MTVGHAPSGARLAPPADPGGGVVVTCHAEAESGARAWSDVLGRPLVRARAIDELAGVAPGEPLTVAVPDGALRIDWLERLARLSVEAGRSLGIVTASAAAARRHRSLGARAPDGPIAAYTHFWDIPPLRSVADVTVHGPGDAGGFLATAERGCQALFLQTYSNGVDMPVGDRVICARLAPPPAGGRASLPCFAGGACLHGPGPDRRPDLYLSPHQLGADVLVMDTCWGIVPDDGLLAPRTSLAAAFMRGPSVRCLLAPIRVQTSAPYRIVDALVRYLAGATLGEVALELNRTGVETREERPCWILHGDPSLRSTLRIPAERVTSTAAGWHLTVPPDAGLCAFSLEGAERPPDGYRALGPVRSSLQASLGPGQAPGSLLLTAIGPRSRRLRELFVVAADAAPVRAARSRDAWIRERAAARVHQAIAVESRSEESSAGAGNLAAQLQDSALALHDCRPGRGRTVDVEATVLKLASALRDGADLDRRLASFLAMAPSQLLGRPFTAYARTTRAAAPVRTARCPFCGAPIEAQERCSVLGDRLRRAVLDCPRCDFASDAPTQASPTFVDVDTGVVRIACDAEALTSAWLSVGSPHTTRRLGVARVAAEIYRPSAGIPVIAALAWDGECAMFRLPGGR